MDSADSTLSCRLDRESVKSEIFPLVFDNTSGDYICTVI